MTRLNAFTRQTRHVARVLVATTTILILAGCSNNQGESQALEHIDRGDTYAQQGQYRAAMIEMRNAIQKNPDDPAGITRLAEIMIKVGAYREASTQLEQWRDTSNPTLQLLLAEAYLKQGKHVSAREILDTLDPEDESKRLVYTTLVAEADRLSGRMINADAGFRDALAMDPGHQPAMLGLTRVKLASEPPQASLEDIAAWLEDHGENAELRLLQGSVFYQQNRLEEAAEALTDGLAALPSSDIFLPERRQILSLLSRTLTEQGLATDAMVYNRILRENTNVEMEENTQAAVDAIASGNLDSARTTLENLIQQNPDSDLVAMLLGAVTVQQGDLDSGTPMLADTIDAEVTPVPFIRLATMAQVDQGQRAQALATLDRSLLARPSDADLLAMHGILALAEPRRANDGVVSLKKALDIDPTRTRLHMALAQYYLSREESEQALQHLRRAFEQHPTDWPATDFYVSVVLAHDLNDEAESARNTLAQHHSDAPYANLLVAMIDYRQGQPQNAIARLEQTISENPDWAEARVALAQVLVNQGELPRAIETLLEAAVLNPDSIDELRNAARLYARNHDTEAVISWLQQMGAQRTDIELNALALAAQIRLGQDDTDAARALLQGHQTTDNAFVQMVSARLLSEEAQRSASAGNWAQARTQAAEAISLQPENVNYKLQLVRITAAEGNIEQADELMTDLETRQAANAQVALTRALVTRQAQTPEAAYDQLREHWETHFNSGVMPELLRLAAMAAPAETTPLAEAWTANQLESAMAWQTLGEQYLVSGDEIRAEAAYREAVDLEPDNVIALNNLAWTLRERNSQEAVEFAGRAAAQAPDNPSVLDTYGWTLHLNGQHQDALEILERAQTLAPDDSDIEQHLATVQSAL